MGKAFLKNTIKNNRPLFSAIVAFNSNATRVLTSTDSSALSTTGQLFAQSGLLESTMASTRGRKRLNAMLPTLLNDIPADWFLDFMEPRTRLALLDVSTLQRLAMHLGLAANAKAVAQCIMRPQVQAIKEAYGEDGYQFAVKRAPFLTVDCSTLLPEPETVCDLPERIHQQGHMGIALCFAQEPKQLRQWIELTLPKEFTRTPDKGAANADAIWTVIRRLLTKEVAPEWAPCFV